jgi:hypothetical protein
MHHEPPKRLPRFRRMTTLALALCSSALAVAGCAEVGNDAEAQRSYAIYASNDFEAASNPPAGWAPTINASEWSLDATTGSANKSYRRDDAGGVWSQSLFTGQGMLGDMTATADMMVDSWNGVTGQAIGIFARYNDNSQGAAHAKWYGAVLASDGFIHIQKKMDDGQPPHELMTVNFVQVQPGVWYSVRLEVTQAYPVRVSIYLDGVMQGVFNDDGTIGGSVISNGFAALGSMGCKAMFDNVSLGDANDVTPYDATTGEDGSESGEAW